MTIEHVRELYFAQPFQPFTLHLADGRNLEIKSREFVLVPPAGRTIAVYLAEKTIRIVDLLLVPEASVQTNGNGHRRPPRSRK
jgi:hypothetical protein